jgi:undecaprenyl-diphosphatase
VASLRALSSAARSGGTVIGGVDRRLLARATTLGFTPADRFFLTASRLANRSRLWLVVAAGLAASGRPAARRAALDGVAAIALTSAVVNGPFKWVARRGRPETASGIRMLLAAPRTTSFPSGHSASAFAFATAVSRQLPIAALPLGAAAASVAYSRVHVGVHYPSDVLVGAGLGVLAGVAAPALRERLTPAHPADPGPDNDLPREVVLLTSDSAGSSDQLDRARAALADGGFRVLAEVPVEDRDRLARWLTDSPPLFLAAGGDGTVGAVADLLAGGPGTLGVLPLGTSNDFARSLGIPLDPAGAVGLLRHGKVARIDAGRLNGHDGRARHFVHAATVGLNVDFAKLATLGSMRKRYGRLTYVVAAVRALRHRTCFECTFVHEDGSRESFELLHLAVINAPAFGGALGAELDGADVDDRLLDVLAVQDMPVPRLLVATARAMLGRRRPVRGVRTLQVRTLQVHTDKSLQVALDGEVIGELPGEFEVAGDALQVVVPTDYQDR